MLLECHIGARIARSFFWRGENSWGNGPAYKCHCSAMMAYDPMQALLKDNMTVYRGMGSRFQHHRPVEGDCKIIKGNGNVTEEGKVSEGS